jgi:cephalosporin-C deacetylase-like acetyl esterase
MRSWRQVALAGLGWLGTAFGGDAVYVQVEDLAGNWREQTNITGYDGRGFRTSNANPKRAAKPLTGTVDIPRTGTYVLWSRGYASPHGRRAFRVKVDDQLFPPQHGGNRRGWFWRRCGTMVLTAGTHRLDVIDADVGFESADVLCFTDDEEFRPMSDAELWSAFPTEGLAPEANALQLNIGRGCELAAARTIPADKAEWEARRTALKKQFQAALGLDPWPERTPLNPRVTGSTERDYYRVENVVFESRPGFLVTANFFAPRGKQGPFPTIVVVPGHAMAEGKNYGLYLTAQLGLVRQGFAVLAYDPIGQGERKRPGFDHPLGYGSFMVGRTNEGYIVWDTIRAIDYLCTRPDVDAERIGLSGNSGGGENTFYTTPLDGRVKAAASFCFTCSYEAWLRDGGNHCVCNHMPGLSAAMEQFEIIGMNAPRPYLAGNAVEDPIFPIAGTRETLAKAKTIYGFYGAGGCVAGAEGPGGHGWSPTLREAAYGWFAKWLQGRGDGSPIAEPDDLNVPKSDDPILQCIKTDADWPASAKTMVDLNRAEAERLQSSYPKTQEACAKALAELLGETPTTTPVGKVVRTLEWEGCTVEPVTITTEDSFEVAATRVTPAPAKPGKAVVIVTDGDRRQAATGGVGRELLQAGISLLVVNPRGVGEQLCPDNHLVSDTVMIGRPLFAQMVWDVRQSIALLRSGDVKQIAVYGEGPCGLLALAAGTLTPVKAVATDRIPASFSLGLADRNPYPLWFYLPNVLKSLDVPQMVMACKAPVLVRDPTGSGLLPQTAEPASSPGKQTSAWLVQAL